MWRFNSFEKFPTMLKDEISSLYPNTEINIIAEPNRRFSTWIHGSNAVCNSDRLSTFNWITQEDYRENGFNCITDTYQ